MNERTNNRMNEVTDVLVYERRSDADVAKCYVCLLLTRRFYDMLGSKM